MRITGRELARPDVPFHIDWTIRPKGFESSGEARANADAVAAMVATGKGIRGDSDLDGPTTLHKYRAIAAWVDTRQADFDAYMLNAYQIQVGVHDRFLHARASQAG